MKHGQLHIAIASLLAFVATLADAFLHAPYAITLPAFALAFFIYLRGFHLRKRIKAEDELPAPAGHLSCRQFSLLVAAFVVASVAGFYTLRYSHPEQTATLHMVISAATFLFGVGFFYRHVFRRQPRQIPNDRNA